MQMSRRFWIANEEEIKRAETTDVYFEYTKHVLAKAGIDAKVVMEVYARSVPYDENWGIVVGIHEVAKLLEGLPVNVKAMDEGELFLTGGKSVIYEPVLQIEGKYSDFCTYENPVLGFLCSLSSVATKAARIRLAAGDKPVFSFGTRRAHPALAPGIERAAYIGGLNMVSNVLGAKLMGKKPVGTMPHAFIQTVGSQKDAWKLFDEKLPEDVPRIALVDTFYDEKAEALMAYEVLNKKLYGIRIDTPTSRRGDWRKLIEEVRWELNIRGANDVKIFVSGGLDEDSVKELRDLVDGYGVGTSVSSPPIIDFSAKIVEVEEGGKLYYRAKRGDIAGRKQVYRDRKNMLDLVKLASSKPPSNMEPLLKDLVKDGKIVRDIPAEDELREKVLENLKLVSTVKPSLRWEI